MNLSDLILVVIFLIFIYDGWRRGAFKVLIESLISLFTILMAFLISYFASSILVSYIEINPQMSQIICFAIIWLILQLIFTIIYFKYQKNFPDWTKTNVINKWVGILISALKILIISVFFLAIINALPLYQSDNLRSKILTNILNSKTNQLLEPITNLIKSPFEGFIQNLYLETSTMLKIEPIIGEKENLGFTYSNGKIDNNAEQELFNLVNEERQKLGLDLLIWNDQLKDASRSYSSDMLSRGFFSHTNPEGLSPFDRLKNRGLVFSSAGENLAIAPTVAQAHEGLMLSPNHRANILARNFKEIGIGAINAGRYGIMFTETFANFDSGINY